MKYIKTYKVFESYSKPEMKYPIDKCLDLQLVLNELYRFHGINARQFDVKYDKYTQDIIDWIGSNLTPILPKYTRSKYNHHKEIDMYGEEESIEYKSIEFDSCYELPISVDTSKDEELYQQKVEDFKRKTGIKDEMIAKINFGGRSQEWVNIILEKIHSLYKEHYKNGKIKVWFSKKEYSRDKEIFDYPINKCYMLSELEEFLDDLGLDTSEFYEWILDNEYIEGRFWEINISYNLEKSDTGLKISENIKKINECLKQIYKIDRLDIYIDYYKKYEIK